MSDEPNQAAACNHEHVVEYAGGFRKCATCGDFLPQAPAAAPGRDLTDGEKNLLGKVADRLLDEHGETLRKLAEDDGPVAASGWIGHTCSRCGQFFEEPEGLSVEDRGNCPHCARRGDAAPGRESRVDLAEARNLLLLALAHVRDEPHAEHFGPFCPVCGFVTAATTFVKEWKP